ncbi:MAG: hypothetical protein AB7I42_26625 [Bradyrhizobium sp.]|uniref:hypothetical protein n=1 Tax=Bradyrhizobium sp. TaxID=376 RepID=UPI003D0EDAEF
MGTAEAAAVGRVVQGTAVSPLDDVIREEAMGRRSLGAALAMLYPLASIARSAQHGVTPCPMLRGEQFGVGFFRCGLDCSGIEGGDAWSERA